MASNQVCFSRNENQIAIQKQDVNILESYTHTYLGKSTKRISSNETNQLQFHCGSNETVQNIISLCEDLKVASVTGMFEFNYFFVVSRKTPVLFTNRILMFYCIICRN